MNEEEACAGGSYGLSDDSVTHQFQYNWKTVIGWKGTCRVMTLVLSDGKTQHASFKLQ
jgi:hypothetical protein